MSLFTWFVFLVVSPSIAYEMKQIKVGTSLIVNQDQDWNYFQLEASSDDSYYLTVKLKQDKFTNLILAIRNASAPVWDSDNIVADYYDLDNYYYSSNSFSIILAPQTYNLETLKIGVYSNVSLIYIISARQSLQKPCFDNCSDKGKCLSGACVCNYGFFGKECRISAERLEMDVKTVIFSRNDYYFYEFENKDEKLEIEIESDTKIEVYTKPDAGYLTLLPSQAEYYKKYSGKSIKFEVKNKGFGNFYLYVQNIANLSISVKSFNDWEFDRNKIILISVISLLSSILMLVFIALVSKYLRDKRVTPIVIRAISVEEINDKYPVAPYDSALSLCESCSICLESFKENDEIRKLFCYHIYHVKCIDTWFINHVFCCVCKRDCKNDLKSGDNSFSAKYPLDDTTISPHIDDSRTPYFESPPGSPNRNINYHSSRLDNYSPDFRLGSLFPIEDEEPQQVIDLE